MSLRSDTISEVETTAGYSGETSSIRTVDVKIAGDGAIAIADGAWVLGADFDRQGFDLLIEGDDGQQLVVRDYFAHSEPADLSLDGGQAILRGGVVERLAGPAADGQYAQLGTTDAGSVGQVQTVNGETWATRVDGTRVALQEGSDIYMGDVLETSPGSSLGVTFVDGTSFSLGEDARMVIDELVYDAGSSSNVASFSLVQGLFVLVSGDVSKTGEMTIETPALTIGIRGTSVAIQAATEGLRNLITLLQDPDGTIGVVEVATAVARVILDTLGATTSVTTADQPPSAVEILQGLEIEALYSTALATMQTTLDSALGLGTSATGEGTGTTPDGTDGSGESGDPAEDGDSPPASEDDVSGFIDAIADLFSALADAVDDDDAEVDEEDAVDEDDLDDSSEDTSGSESDDEDDDDGVDLTSVSGKTRVTDEGTGNGGTDSATVNVTITSPAAPVEAIKTDNNEVFLGGTFVELGVAANGTMGTLTDIPDSFGASEHSNQGGLSFFFNPAGTDNDSPKSGDAFLPGSPVETFSLGFTDGTGTFLSHNENEGQFTGIPMDFVSLTAGADGTSVVTAGGVSGRMGLSQSVTLDGLDSFYTTTVTLTNNSGGAMTNVRYMRNNDPDQDFEAGGSTATINDVLLNPNSPGIAAVNAQGQTGGQNILMLADQTAMNNDNGLAQDTIEVRASAFGFENTNPFVGSAFSSPADPNGAFNDIGINLVFAIDSLAAGQSVTFSWVTSINTATDGNDIMAALLGQTTVAAGDGDDIIYASQASTSETLAGMGGDDTLVAYSTGTTNGDILLGGDGMDRLIDGAGVDTFTGGAGADKFIFDDSGALYDVAGNTAFNLETTPQIDTVTDFVSGTDKLQFVASAFGNLAIGALTNGISFSVINDSYDGTNAGVNLNHGLGTSSFVYSKADGVLFYDDNGSGAGYQAVADVSQPGAGDIQIVAAA